MERGGAPYLTVDPNTGAPVAMYPDGSVVPVQSSPAPAMTQGGTNAIPSVSGSASPQQPVGGNPLWFAAEAATPAPTGTAGNGAARGYASGGGTQNSTGGAREYGGGWDAPTGLPQYADGRAYPAYGSPIPEPGDDRQTTYLETPHQPPPQRAYGGSAIQGESGGGGGGGSPLYYQLKAKGDAMAAKVQGFGGGTSSSGGSAGFGGTPSENMSGKYAKGLDAGQAAGLSLRPTAMLPRVFGGGFSPADPLYSTLAGLPAAQIAMLAGGYSGSPEDLANNLGQVYRGAARGDLPSTGKMIGQLAHSKGINQMFGGVKAGPGDYPSTLAPGYVYGQEPLPMGEAAATVGGLLDAALINEPIRTQMKYSGTAPGAWGSFLIDKGSSKALKKPAGKGTPLNKFVARRIFR
jgi:hypothetical protein